MEEIYVFDTYAYDPQGQLLHFDVLMNENSQDKALSSAKIWLESLNIGELNIEQIGCQFCHARSGTPEVASDIKKQGYHIIKLKGFT